MNLYQQLYHIWARTGFGSVHKLFKLVLLCIVDADIVDVVFMVVVVCREMPCESFTLLFGSRSLKAR